HACWFHTPKPPLESGNMVGSSLVARPGSGIAEPICAAFASNTRTKPPEETLGKGRLSYVTATKPPPASGATELRFSLFVRTVTGPPTALPSDPKRWARMFANDEAGSAQNITKPPPASPTIVLTTNGAVTVAWTA